jgi:5-methylcytosine-specific restriction enzyme subunit McrC
MPAASLIRLREHEARTVALAPAELAALQRDLAHALAIAPGDAPGRYRLRAGSVAGCVALPGGRVLVIEPKVGVDTLFALLAAVYDPGRALFRNEPLRYTTVAALFEFVVAIWAAQIEDVIARGVQRGYRTLVAEGEFVRGRLLLAETLRRRPGRPERHWSAYRELGADVPENRILRWTALALLGYPYRSARLAARLARIARVLGAAGAAADPAAPAELARLPFHRLNERYRPALALARLLLDGLTFSGAPAAVRGGEPFLAYLVDMNWLFERYAGVVLRAGLAGSGLAVREQERHPLDAARRLSVRPDVILYRQARPVLVLDAKYRLTADEGDLYQLVAYCHVLGLRRGGLLYPAGERAPAGEVTVRGLDVVRVRYFALDLAGGPEELAVAAVGLAGAVADWAAPS